MRLPLLLLPLLCVGCSAVSHGSRLSDSPPGRERGVFLSTGGSPRPFRTLGFAQITGYGVTVAGVSDLGDAAIDSTLHRTLVEQALRMGGDGVINIEFEDENPPTAIERVSDLSESISNVASGEGGVKTRDRNVLVTGEIIQFVSTR